jgi:hypothetical protein
MHGADEVDLVYSGLEETMIAGDAGDHGCVEGGCADPGYADGGVCGGYQ